MANARIPKAKRAQIISLLCEGMAINSICRVLSVGKNNVMRAILEVGEACEDWHNKHFVGIQVERLELDEQWNFIHTHRERMSRAEKLRYPERGDCWLWCGMDPESKAIIGWRTGKRGAAAARDFVCDLERRTQGRVQITSDQLKAYAFAIRGEFGDRADYALEHKVFSTVEVTGHEWMKRKTNPLVGVEREAVLGNPDLKTSTVCHMERFFLTMRQANKRCARKTLAYSKDWENHALTASVQIFVYNLVRKHETTKTTPAMKLGIVDRRWTLEDVVDMADAFLKAKEEAAFEAAFSQFSTEPKVARTYPPTPKDQIPLPWYLNPDSDGPPEKGMTD